MSGFASLKKVTVGDLRHRCELQKNTATTRDDRGHVTPTWTTLTRPWCKIMQLSAIEAENARQISPEATHRIFARHNNSFVPGNRIKFGDRLFYIGAVDDVEQIGRFVIVLAAEKLR